MTERPLKIGYLWQYEAAGLSPVAATSLHIQAVVRGFQRRGHQVRILTVQNGWPHWSDDWQTWHKVDSPGGRSPAFRMVERGVRAVQSRLNLPYIRLFECYRYAQAVKRALADCDVFYERFWLLGYGGLMAAEGLQKPLVYEVNGDLVEEYAQLGIQLPESHWRAIRAITHRMFSRAAKVVTVSDTLRQRTLQRWNLPPEQVQAISNGAHVELFAAPPAGDAAARWGLEGAPVVMFVGSFKPWHGLDLLVQAFAQVAAKHPTAKLALVGDGPVRPELEAQAERLGLQGRVVFTGAVAHTEVASLLQAAQVAVVNPRLSPASLSQSPLKLFEYMAAGKAIVAPAIPNVQAVLTDGENGLLTPPDQPSALAERLLLLLSNPDLRQRLGETARRQALEQHSWDRTVAEIEAIFYAALDKNPAHKAVPVAAGVGKAGVDAP